MYTPRESILRSSAKLVSLSGERDLGRAKISLARQAVDFFASLRIQLRRV